MATGDVTTSKKLHMVFGLADGRNLTISVTNPKDDLETDAAPVKTFMQAAITGAYFAYGGSLATKTVDAYIQETSKTDVADWA